MGPVQKNQPSSEGDAQQLHQALLLLKRSRCLNVSAFCRAAIAEKLKQQEASK